MPILEAENFDRDLGLRDLLPKDALPKLQTALRTMLGENARVVDLSGAVLIGNNGDQGKRQRVPLHFELEPIGYLEANVAEEQLRPVAVLLELLLRSSARYHMASQLHIEAIRADYEKLQQKHEALKESEARYKALAENLEQRVQEQVKSIETAQRQLYQSEKMASVGQLAAGVAHEINNPIGFILSNLRTAQSYVEKIAAFGKRLSPTGDSAARWKQDGLDEIIEDFPDMLQESVDGANRVARIVADLKGFSNVDCAEEELADVNKIIESVCNVAAGQIKQHANVKLDLGSLPFTRCRPGHLGQVFLNILLNAAQAMAERPGNINIHTNLDAEQITIRVADQGMGITESDLSRVFDPFFTTREVGQGTGLGLTVSRDIIQTHGGRITAASQEGVGTTFTIVLPVKE